MTGRPDVLGVVGSGYTVVQNEEHCELLNLLVDEAGAHFETAGSLRGGRETFVTMKLPHTLTLDTGHGSGHTDDVELYLAAMSSHDGTAAWRVIVTPVRIVCANTQRMALSAAKATYAIRHTRTARSRIAQARQALGLVWRYCDAFETAAQQMINQTLVLDEFQTVIDQLWDGTDDPANNVTPRAAGIRDRRNTTLRGLFLDADTQQVVRGTRWAGLQAITEYLDHHAPPRTTPSGPTGYSPPTPSQSASSAPISCLRPSDPARRDERRTRERQRSRRGRRQLPAPQPDAGPDRPPLPGTRHPPLRRLRHPLHRRPHRPDLVPRLPHHPPPPLHATATP